MQIDWLTVAAQIVNFLVLVWLLQRFLYRPITAAMAQREGAIAARLSEAGSARAEVEADARRLERARQALEDSRAHRLAAAEDEARALRARLEAEIRQEMDRKRGALQDQLDQERNALADSLRRKAGHAVIDIAGRVLRDYADSDLGAQVAANFARRLAALDAPDRARLIRAAERIEGPAQLISGIDLTPAMQATLTQAVRDCIGQEIAVAHRRDDDLVLGLRLTIGEQSVEWSAAGFLDRLSETLDEVIESARHGQRGAPSGPGGDAG